MRVKIGDQVFDPAIVPIIIQFTPQDRVSVMQLPPGDDIWCVHPPGWPQDQIDAFMASMPPLNPATQGVPPVPSGPMIIPGQTPPVDGANAFGGVSRPMQPQLHEVPTVPPIPAASPIVMEGVGPDPTDVDDMTDGAEAELIDEPAPDRVSEMKEAAKKAAEEAAADGEEAVELPRAKVLAEDPKPAVEEPVDDTKEAPPEESNG